MLEGIMSAPVREPALPEPPKYLNKAERAQYQAALAEFLGRLKPNAPYKGLVGIDPRDLSNVPRLNGSG
jgi:hypothetical protein